MRLSRQLFFGGGNAVVILLLSSKKERWFKGILVAGIAQSRLSPMERGMSGAENVKIVPW
jgi:hypothetical protein